MLRLGLAAGEAATLLSELTFDEEGDDSFRGRRHDCWFGCVSFVFRMVLATPFSCEDPSLHLTDFKGSRQSRPGDGRRSQFRASHRRGDRRSSSRGKGVSKERRKFEGVLAALLDGNLSGRWTG